MTYAPRFSYNAAMLTCAEAVGAYRRIAQALPLPLAVERQLRRESRVRVAHNSTWIENRTLALEEAQAIIADKALADPSRAHGQAAQEVRNYFNALDLLDRHGSKPCTEAFICQVHAMIMKGGAPGRPKLRSPYRQINVQVGNMTYVPPEWQAVPELMAKLAAWATGPGLKLPRAIYAGILAYQFVTIHPFSDGNGRTCRALATWALGSGPDDQVVDPIGLLKVEECYAADLEGYYDALQMGCHMDYALSNAQGSRSDPDLTPWLTYFCTMLQRSAQQVTTTILDSFQAAHPEALADPLIALPGTFRRLLARLPDADAEITPRQVADIFQVSDKTAREWLKAWHQDDLIHPAKPDAQRIRSYRLSPTNAAILAADREAQG